MAEKKSSKSHLPATGLQRASPLLAILFAVLAVMLATLLDEPEKRAAMSRAMRGWSKPDAALESARAVLEVAKK